jgi:hypothetical protein
MQASGTYNSLGRGVLSPTGCIDARKFSCPNGTGTQGNTVASTGGRDVKIVKSNTEFQKSSNTRKAAMQRIEQVSTGRVITQRLMESPLSLKGHGVDRQQLEGLLRVQALLVASRPNTALLHDRGADI